MNKELTGDELKAICTRLLGKFDEICRDNQLKYCAAGGTMLGAVRHKGFIPWDDDIDVNMPREDYERLLQLEYEDENYKILNYRYCDGYYYTFTKMIDKRTCLNEPSRGETEMGVFIDIFPVDYVGDYHTAAPKNVRKAWKSSRFWEHLGSDIHYKKAASPQYLAKLLFRGCVYPFRKKLLHHFDTAFAKLPPSEYCANLQLGTYGIKECFPSILWEDMIYLPFEDVEVAAFRDYDTYLTCLFGDYMTPPPEEQRASTHSFSAYWKTDEIDL